MVYVDDMRAPFRSLIMCHMLADTDAELREMARTIGVQQRWHQGDHFDICLSKRALAVKAGAIEITLRQAAAMSFRRKVTGKLGLPEEAKQWREEWRAQRAAAAAAAAAPQVQQPGVAG